jgi:hypothetical protein
LSSRSPDQEDYSRELSLGECFTKTFDLARRNYVRLLPLFASVGIVVAIISAYINYVTPAYTLPSNPASLGQSQLLASMTPALRAFGYFAASVFVSSLILYFAAGIGVWKICQQLDREQKLNFTFASKINYLNLALTTLLSVALVEGSIIVLVGPLIFGTMLYFSLVASTIENKSPLSSLGRSLNLISHKWGKTFLVVIGIQIIVYLVSLLIGSVVGFLPLSDSASSVAVNASQNFILALGFPLVSASMVVLYSSYTQSQVRSVQRPPSLYDNMKPQPMGNFGQVRPQNIAYCPSCGTSVAQDERFCHHCGRALTQP